MESFPITSLCKEDIKSLTDDPEMHEKIDALTVGQMTWYAGKFADDYIGQLYWSQIELIILDDLKASDSVEPDNNDVADRIKQDEEDEEVRIRDYLESDNMIGR